MLLDQKILVPNTSNDTGTDLYRVSGYLKAASQDKVLLRFNPELKPKVHVNGLTRTRSDGWYTYLPCDGAPTYFEVEAFFPKSVFGDVTVTLEHWIGNSTVTVYLENLVNFPKLLYLGSLKGCKSFSKLTQLPIEYWADNSPARKPNGSLFDGVVADTTSNQYQWASDFADNNWLPLFSHEPLTGEILRVDTEEPLVPKGSLHGDFGQKFADELITSPLNERSNRNGHKDLVGIEIVRSDGLAPFQMTQPVQFSSPLREFRISYRFIADKECDTKSALISFLIKTDTPDWEAGSCSPPIYKSKHEHIGHYRYIAPSPSGLLQHLDVSLPRGVVCEGVSFQKFGRQEFKMAIGDISVVDLAQFQNHVNQPR